MPNPLVALAVSFTLIATGAGVVAAAGPTAAGTELDQQTFAYNGSTVGTYSPPAGTGILKIVAIGGGGGSRFDDDGMYGNGGAGAVVTTYQVATEATVLTVKVGGGGGLSLSSRAGTSQGGAATAVTGPGVTVVAGGGGGGGQNEVDGGSGSEDGTPAGGNGHGTLYGFGGNSDGHGTGGAGSTYLGGCGGPVTPGPGGAGGTGGNAGQDGLDEARGPGGGGFGGGNGGNTFTVPDTGGLAADFANDDPARYGGGGAGFGGGGAGQYHNSGGGGYGGGGGGGDCQSEGAGGAGGSFATASVRTRPATTYAPGTNGAPGRSTAIGGNGSVEITAYVADPVPPPTGKKNQSLPIGAVPKSAREPGSTVVNRTNALTVQGQPVTARLRVALSTRGDITCLRARKGAKRKLTAIVNCRSIKKIRVTYTAPGNDTYNAFRRTVWIRVKQR